MLTEAYSEDEFYNDILRVTGGQTNEQLARMTIRASATCTEWMKRYGVRFQHAMGGTLHLGRTNAFFLGGGKAMMNAYFARAERAGIRVVYNAEVVDLDVVDGEFRQRHGAGGRQTRADRRQSAWWRLRAASNRIWSG